MPISTSNQTDPAGSNDVQLDVSVAGSEVTVSPGQFTVDGQQYSLIDSQVHVVEESSNKSWLLGYLAKADNDAIVVLVDRYEDPELEMYKFDDGLYERLWLLYAATLAPSETDVENFATLQVLHIAPEVEE